MAKSNANTEKTPEQAVQDQIRAEHEYVIKNKRVRRQTRRRAIIIILLIFLLIIALLAGATYAVMSFVEDSNFRVTVTQTGTAWLSLSKDSAFTNPTSVLDVSAPKNMDNITLCNSLDELLNDIVNTDGSYEGRGSDVYYIATTFYLTNSGTQNVKYKENITLERALRGMDKAIRVMLIKDDNLEDDSLGEVIVYAAYASDEEGNDLEGEDGLPVREEVVPEVNYMPKDNLWYDGFTFDDEDFDENGVWYAKPFAGNGYVHNSELYPLEPGDKIKYSVVIWLEGQDAQCVGDNDSQIDAERGILGGQVKLTVEFVTEQK